MLVKGAKTGLVHLGDGRWYDPLVLAYYLAEEISLGRAAELLDIPWLDLRTRCLRLDVPLRSAPADSAEAEEDVASAAAWFENRHS